jgi:enoyl-CoA hydratase/carnithine racemase
MKGTVLLERSRDAAVVTIRNPVRHNALSIEMWDMLRRHFLALEGDETLRCIVIQGARTEAFSAGADLSEFAEVRANVEQVTRYHEECVGPCLAAIGASVVPVVAKIRGFCMGGGLEIACACDIRLADETARFGAPVGRFGFPLAFAETQGLFNLVGPTVAAELLLEGRILSASEARDRQLVTRLVAAVELDNEAAVCVENLCRSGRWASRSHKKQLRRLLNDSSPVTYEERQEVYRFAETDEYQQSLCKLVAQRT